MRIRKFRKEDAIKVSNIIKRCCKEINLGCGCYSRDATEALIKDNSPKKLIEYSKDTKYFVAIENNDIIGMGGYNKEKIRTMFVKPEYHKKGIGAMLLRKILSEAKRDGIKRLGCWSTVYAKKFYEHFGFKDKGEISFPGSTLKFVNMEKKL